MSRSVKRSRQAARLCLATLLLLTLALFFAASVIAQNSSETNPGKTATATATATAPPVDPRPGVVRIRAAGANGVWQTGTGFIFRSDFTGEEKRRLYILTVTHVVKSARKIEVELYTQRNSRHAARTVQIDARDPNGFAVLRLDLPATESFAVLSVDSAAPGSVGREVIAVGFPRKGDPWDTTAGLITARQSERIDFSARVDSGNSGGPLLDDRTGRVIGIVTSTAGKSGFARPARAARRWLTAQGIRLPFPELPFPTDAALVKHPDAMALGLARARRGIFLLHATGNGAKIKGPLRLDRLNIDPRTSRVNRLKRYTIREQQCAHTSIKEYGENIFLAGVCYKASNLQASIRRINTRTGAIRHWKYAPADGNYRLHTMIPDGDGFLALGSRRTESNPGKVWLLRIDREGQQIAHATLGARETQNRMPIMPDMPLALHKDGQNIFVTGERMTISADRIYWTDQLKRDSRQLETKRIQAGKQTNVNGTSLADSIPGQGLVVVSGGSGQFADIRRTPTGEIERFNRACTLLHLRRLRANGTRAWQRTSPICFDPALRISMLSAAGDGSTCMAGTHKQRGWILKFNPEGRLLWKRQLTYDGMSFASILAADDGGCLLAGSFWRNPGNDALLFKLDRDGHLQKEPRLE